MFHSDDQSLAQGFISPLDLVIKGAKLSHGGQCFAYLDETINASASISYGALRELGTRLDTAFGDNAASRINQWLDANRVSTPTGLLAALGVSIVVDEIAGISTGAYIEDHNVVFLSNQFFQNSTPDSLTGVLVEELGHAIDAKLNPSDSSGDEGEIFADLALGKEQDFSNQLAENDLHSVSISGIIYNVELNSPISVFEHANFSGRSKQFAIGDHAFIGNDFNDILTSIRIPTGSNIVVELFEHANFQGRATLVSYSQASVGADWNDPNWRVSHMNDSVSSLKVRFQRPDEIIFYQHGNFQGLAHSGPLGSNSTVRFNDDYSSIDLPANIEISVFEHSNYGGLRATYSADIPFLGNLNDKISSYIAYRPDIRDVRISRIQGPNIVENKETWFVIHGWNNGEIHVRDLASAIEDFDGVRGSGDQVFAVDWHAARTNLNLRAASLSIDTVAEALKQRIQSWGIDPSKVNIVGHSLGAYIAYELSERLGGVNRIVALHPASLTVGGYNVAQVDFSRFSNRSWAFHHNNVTDLGLNALTADESFILETPRLWSSTPNLVALTAWRAQGHGSGKIFWANMLRNRNSVLGRLFGLDSIRARTAPWRIDRGWEARIELNRSLIATGRHWEA